MSSILRQIVASPRVRHEEAGLDLCYVTDNIIATSGPGSSYPQVAYRNPLKDLVRFLDAKHGEDWSIWEFRAEGTGYDDDDVHGRIRHYPWPDHHPPPFALIPLIMGSMRNWLKEKDSRVVVVHCKAGKGRSGTVACSYLISEEGWSPEEAMQRFTERRMRPGFGAGISIPSQRRTISYVDRWTKHDKLYVERPVEVLELHIWGLRDGVKIAVEGYVEEGKVIKTFHTFQRSEREIVRGSISKETGLADAARDFVGRSKKRNLQARTKDNDDDVLDEVSNPGLDRVGSDLLMDAGGDVVFRPGTRVVLPSSDVNMDFERRNKTKYGGFTMVTAVAHVWFNAFFEGRGPEQGGKADSSGVFEIEWDAMDGIKGSSKKGIRAFDRMAVVWQAIDVSRQRGGSEIRPPAKGEAVAQMRPATERQTDDHSQDNEKRLGLREATAESAPISRASSVTEMTHNARENEVQDEIEGVKSCSQQGDIDGTAISQTDGLVAGAVSGVQHLSTESLPDGQPEAELANSHRSAVGSLHKAWKKQHTVS
ncbi:hypothetical protein BAUCODRAFT_474719 [Baudoinia panamericana UAMH 10762]|uniref:phosphatidylinositol-3,4,5-trisphosphate 3-phosphatase n=1 Tax=Baudoinia panamericana (strain UAMH 10762) TaxID=717646 RepID=M2MXY1_BAUPA|nr:uncharacterized protein BAUCODRAFT_474719 [Baudoinia panamericana UAMH 10762]EMC96433.1 hypothetical protein BAUCODRAFT_474719 [Baudoinia panamericana UAMH 10762]